MNISGIEFSILGPGLLAGILITLTHVPLGQRVLARGIIFLDLAVAQFAAFGLIAAHSVDWQPHSWQVQVIAVLSALVGVLILNTTEKRWPEIQEALIGIMFVIASSGSILLLANNPHGGEQLKEILTGQILWVNYSQLIPVTILYAFVLGTWFKVNQVSSLVFYILFALTITASVQLVGIYLVFASLIIPALVIRKAHNSLWLGYLVGITGYLLGLIVSALLDLPAGAMIVLTLAITSVVVAYIKKGPANAGPSTKV